MSLERGPLLLPLPRHHLGPLLRLRLHDAQDLGVGGQVAPGKVSQSTELPEAASRWHKVKVIH